MLLKYIDREVKKIRREWQIYRRKIAKQISPSQRSILADLDDIFLKATSKLLADLQSPTLTIVTTGTTSSGKSTLVNLLCGAEIIPVAVQEMSAGRLSKSIVKLLLFISIKPLVHYGHVVTGIILAIEKYPIN